VSFSERDDRETRTPALYIRARFALFEWHCPKCGKWNLSHVGYKTGYLMRCKGHHRGNIFVLGHSRRPYDIKGKRPPWAPDMVFPPDRKFRPAAWRAGEPVNEILP
jgi:hypothetical protein